MESSTTPERKLRIGFAFMLASLITIVTYISIKPKTPPANEQQQQQVSSNWPTVCVKVFVATFLGAIFIGMLLDSSSLLPKTGGSGSGGSGEPVVRDSVALSLALSHIDRSVSPPF
jgi:hypothetical protein